MELRAMALYSMFKTMPTQAHTNLTPYLHITPPPTYNPPTPGLYIWFGGTSLPLTLTVTLKKKIIKCRWHFDVERRGFDVEVPVELFKW
jgi:hypothetical protein